jgi:hypothetical protein
MKLNLDKALLGWSLAMAVVVGGAATTAAVSSTGDAKLHTIDVQRINVREPDGTLRMVFANDARMPGIIHRNVNYPHPNRSGSGVLFFNDEGTENGGFSWGGSKDPKTGVVDSGGHLSFDQYEQDQVLTLDQQEHNGSRMAGLAFLDRPDNAMPFAEMGKFTSATQAEKDAMLKKWVAEGRLGAQQRAFVGKLRDKSSAVTLADAKGRPRILLQVKADGAAAIQFLGDDGKPVKTIAP